MIAWPRDEENRYRLYALSERSQLRIVASGPSLEHVGCAIGTCFEEEAWSPTDRIGILDTRAVEEGSGVWVVNPYA